MIDQKLNCSSHFAALHFFAARIFISTAAEEAELLPCLALFSLRRIAPAAVIAFSSSKRSPLALVLNYFPLRNWLSFFLPAPGVGLTFHKILLASTRSLCSSRILKCIGCFFELRCFPFLKFIFDFCNRMWYNVFSISSSITARQRIYLSEGKTI